MGAIAGIFPIGETGEDFVIAEWVPDPKVIEAELLKLANQIDDWTVPLTRAKAAFIYETQMYFEGEFDPYGRAWTPLEEQYERAKTALGYEGNILHRTGTLEEAATAPSNWIIAEHNIIFQTENLPFYGPYHQFGTMDAMTQAITHKTRSQSERLFTGQKALEKHFLTDEEAGHEIPTGVGHGHALPQRMFIGADEFVIDEVQSIFLKWLDDTIDESAFGRGGASGGSISLYGSNVLGTFPIMGRLGTGQPILRTPAGPRFGSK